jgi:predicted RNA-binding Zn-ribbon protein involved in translation (DUF1610 family)
MSTLTPNYFTVSTCTANNAWSHWFEDILCPTCRQVTPIPDGRVAELQSAFHINHLLDIRKTLQRGEDPQAAEVHVRYCSVHPGEAVKLFCETCGEVVCHKCALKSGRHHSHDYEELNEAFEKYIREITPSFEPMKKQVTTIIRALYHLPWCSV